MTSQVLTQPDIRKERVEALRLAVAEGRYHVSSKQIASAMVEEILQTSKHLA